MVLARSKEINSVAVLGAGPAGLAAALALAGSGQDVVLLAPPYDPNRLSGERRTAALFGPSIEFLVNLGVWAACAPASAPIRAVRIADVREGLVHVPEMVFHSAEIGFETFGSNVPNAVLLQALAAAAAADPRIAWIPTSRVVSVHRTAEGIRLECAEERGVVTRLLVAADGRDSVARQAAGISVRRSAYPQIAIATTFAHARPHRDSVIELHGAHGPCTIVPMPCDRSSLVWVESPDTAQTLLAMDPVTFAERLEERLQGVLGVIDDVGPRAAYPLAALTASRMGASGIALVGEAAHVIPPIGAQGLNLGLRDAAALADCVSDAHANGHDVAGDEVLDAYHRMRNIDVLMRSASVDILNRSLLTDMVPVDVLRSLSARLIANFHPLRRLFMLGGMGNAGHLPQLMRPNASPPAS